MLYRLDLIELGFAKMRQDRYCILYIQYPNHIYIICKYIFFWYTCSIHIYTYTYDQDHLGQDLLKWIGFQTSVEDVQAMVRRGNW